MKKLLSILLSAVLVVSVISIIPFAASAETSGICGENSIWEYDPYDYTLIISGAGAISDYSYDYDTGITTAPWGLYYNDIKTAIIDSGITSIGSCAFRGCTGLKNVVIPDGVKSIGKYAFYGCEEIVSPLIPDSVILIGQGAFSGTDWYQNQPAGLVYAGKVAYRYKGEFPTSVTIKEGTTGLAEGIFISCTGLDSVTIPDSVVSIGNSAFSYCKGLTSIELGNSVKYIGDKAFLGCSGLVSIMLGKSVSSIGENAFYGCTGLTSVELGDSVTYIGDKAFLGCSGLVSITLGNSVQSIGDNAFSGCSGLTSVTIPDSVVSIGNNAFSWCTGLISVAIGNSVLSIGENAFSGCSKLIMAIIPASVVSIGDNAFSQCLQLSDIYYAGTELQKEAIEIGDDNFYLNNAAWHYDYVPDQDIPGDINGDNLVNNKDLTRLFQFLSGWDVDVNANALDVNSDGSVNNKDLTRLFQYLSGWDVEMLTIRTIYTPGFENSTTGFAWPVPGYYGISSPFGVRYGKNHNGIDISGGGINGKPIVAIADGVVTIANKSGYGGGYGIYCAINHGTITINGASAQYVAFYAHATRITVSVGQRVSKGQVIGYVGSTGHSTGPHLHLGIQKNGTWVNPLPLVR